MDNPYKVLSSRDIYRNAWITVQEDTVLRPDGNQGVFGIVELVPSASILAVSNERFVHLIKEYKYAIGAETIQVASGALEVAETPLAAAKRELQEELGLMGAEWVSFGLLNPLTTVVRAPNHMFMALDIREAPPPIGAEYLPRLSVTLSRAVEMVMEGEITHAATCVLILKADKYFRQ